jgi:YVTN family beta-propeller protein
MTRRPDLGIRVARRKLFVCVGLLVLAVLSAPAFSAEHIPALSSTSPSNERTLSNSAQHELGGAVTRSQDATRLDLVDSTGFLNQTIAVGDSPNAVVYDSGTGDVFVANEGSDNISVLDGGKVVATVVVGDAPYAEAYDGARSEVFVANSGMGQSDAGSLTVINDGTDRAAATIPVEGTPVALAYDPEKGEVFVGSYANPADVSVVNDTTNTVVANISLDPEHETNGPSPVALAYDRSMGEILVFGYNFSSDPALEEVYVINDTRDNVTATIQTGTGQPGVGDIPYGAIVYDSTRGEVFVAAQDSDSEPGGKGGWVTVINGTTDQIVTKILSFFSPDGLAYSPELGQVYVSNAFGGGAYWANLSVISDVSNSYVANVSLGAAGAEPAGVSYDPASGTAFVADSASNNVTEVFLEVFSASLNSSRTSVDVGEPFWVNSSLQGGFSPFRFVYTWPQAAGCLSTGTSSLQCDPTAVDQRFNVSVQVLDGIGAYANATSMTLSVDGAALGNLLSLSNRTPWLGDSISITSSPSGGDQLYSYAYAGLPPGCVTTNSSMIGCLPTQVGFYNITSNVTDGNGAAASATVELQVLFDFTVTAPLQTRLGQPLTIQVLAPAGIAGLVYSYSGLPPGCGDLDAASLTCTPTQLGTYYVVASVHDAAGDQNSHEVVVEVVRGSGGPQGFLGLGSTGDYLLVAVVAALAVVALAFLVGRLVPVDNEKEDARGNGFREFNHPPGDVDDAPIKTLASGETDPAEDIF